MVNVRRFVALSTVLLFALSAVAQFQETAKPSGVRLESAEYPAGKEFTLPVEPKTNLIVYTGEFTIQARFVAQPGDHMVEAKLRYQACDANACLPPKTITVPIDIVGN